jgi:hypothetical protein
MPLAAFEPTIPASERLQTHNLNGAATAIDKITILEIKYCYEKLALMGRILFKLSSFTNLVRRSHTSSPGKTNQDATT